MVLSCNPSSPLIAAMQMLNIMIYPFLLGSSCSAAVVCQARIFASDPFSSHPGKRFIVVGFGMRFFSSVFVLAERSSATSCFLSPVLTYDRYGDLVNFISNVCFHIQMWMENLQTPNMAASSFMVVNIKLPCIESEAHIWTSDCWLVKQTCGIQTLNAQFHSNWTDVEINRALQGTWMAWLTWFNFSSSYFKHPWTSNEADVGTQTCNIAAAASWSSMNADMASKVFKYGWLLHYAYKHGLESTNGEAATTYGVDLQYAASTQLLHGYAQQALGFIDEHQILTVAVVKDEYDSSIDDGEADVDAASMDADLHGCAFLQVTWIEALSCSYWVASMYLNVKQTLISSFINWQTWTTPCMAVGDEDWWTSYVEVADLLSLSLISDVEAGWLASLWRSIMQM
ncbi:hypothetical protein Dimus_018326 [Dionaea muscipula]